MFFQSECTDITEVVAANKPLEPYVVSVDDEEAYLVVDKTVVDKVAFEDVPFLLMSAFFVYNICYTKGCSNMYAFLEVVMLKFPPEKASPTVKHLLAKLGAH